jgi:hypothetical protein
MKCRARSNEAHGSEVVCVENEAHRESGMSPKSVSRISVVTGFGFSFRQSNKTITSTWWNLTAPFLRLSPSSPANWSVTAGAFVGTNPTS